MLFVLLAACGTEPTEPEPIPEPTPTPQPVPPNPVEEAAAIAKAIRANPAGAEAVLKEHNTTREAYEAQLFEIAADAEKSKAYAEALK